MPSSAIDLSSDFLIKDGNICRPGEYCPLKVAAPDGRAANQPS
jgi:hypothetical protein